MDHLDPSRRDTRHTWVLAIALIAAIFVAGMPTVQALATKITGSVKVKNGAAIDSQATGNLGEDALGTKGSNAAVAVRTYAGGSGLIGIGDCDPASPRQATVTVQANAKTIVTGIIVTGTDATVAVRAPALEPVIGPGPAANFRVSSGNPNLFVGLGNGLTVLPSELEFTCTGADGTFVILGQ